MLPKLMTLSTDKQKGFIRLSQNGINVTETSTLFFKVTSCEKGQFFLLPAGEVIGDRVHKFVVQKKTEGNITAKHAKCIIIGYENFECDQGVTYPMQSICNGTETFWIRMKSSGEVGFGKGCNPEIGTMSTHIDEKPFSLGDIGLSSNVLAKWKLGKLYILNEDKIFIYMIGFQHYFEHYSCSIMACQPHMCVVTKAKMIQ